MSKYKSINTPAPFLTLFVLAQTIGCSKVLTRNNKPCFNCFELPFTCEDVALITSKEWKTGLPTISITQDSISISRETIISLHNGEVRQEDIKGTIVPSLYNSLRQIHSDPLSSSKQLNILASSDIPWPTLRHLLYNSGQAQFDQFQLLGTSKEECLNANSWRQHQFVPMYAVDIALPLMPTSEDPVEFIHPARITILEDHLELYPPYIERQDLAIEDVSNPDSPLSSTDNEGPKTPNSSEPKDVSDSSSEVLPDTGLFAVISIPCTDGCTLFDTNLLREHLVRLEQTALPIRHTQSGSSPYVTKVYGTSDIFVGAHQGATVQTLLTVIEASKIESGSDAFKNVFISGEIY